MRRAVLDNVGECYGPVRAGDEVAPMAVLDIVAGNFKDIGGKRPALLDRLLGRELVRAAVGEHCARADRRASRQRRAVGVARAQHHPAGIKAEHAGNQLGEHGLMSLAACAGDAVEHDFVLRKADRDLIFRAQAAAGGL